MRLLLSLVILMLTTLAFGETSITVVATNMLWYGGEISTIVDNWHKSDDSDSQVDAIYDASSIFYYAEIPKDRSSSCSSMHQPGAVTNQHMISGQCCSGWKSVSSGNRDGHWFKEFVVTYDRYGFDALRIQDTRSTLCFCRSSIYNITICRSLDMPKDPPWMASGEGEYDIIDDVTPNFDGSSSHLFNGVVYGPDVSVCGLVQISTAKLTTRGIRVSGFMMLEDGKKQTLKSTTAQIENGFVNITAKVGRIGDMTLTIGGNGFKGALGAMTVISGTVGEDVGILKGTLKMSYFDAKTNKIKTKNVAIGGVAAEGEAVGTATVKGKGTKSFAAEIE